MKEIEKGFTEGLLKGFAGEGNMHKIEKAGIPGKSVQVKLDNGGVYQDEWFSGEQLGGGKELLEIDGQRYIRLYAGGTPEAAFLDRLEISHSDVNSYLVRKIKELGDETRLFEDCKPEPDGAWQYKYRVTSKDIESGVATGRETINYSGMQVHLHEFILSPIK